MAVGAHRLFRPPAEGDSLIVRIMDGCPWNACAFCGMYKGVTARSFSEPEMAAEIRRAAREDRGATRVFLADGDVMALSAAAFAGVLSVLRQELPRLKRVSAYANGSSIMEKGAAELARLRELGLHTLYLGLESGDDAVLRRMRKRETAGEMIEAVQRAQECGLRLSVMVLVGLGGREGSADHARSTAAALNRMQPRLLSALRVIPIPGTELARWVETGAFRPLTEWDAARELRDLLAALELRQTVFRADHASNVVPLEGRFPRDRERLLGELDRLLASGTLDRSGPGVTPLWL
ncbi:MAG: radical SAM protein [Lentisphaeria bacterium]|nr:radical SAM protein [Lentisphaeria bacterium]